MNLTKEELIHKIEEEQVKYVAETRPMLESSLWLFNRFVQEVEKGRGSVKLAPVHKEIGAFMDNHRYHKKLLLIPRGHLKSTLVTVGYSLQAICKNPGIRILISNATYNLACSFLNDIKRNLKFNDKLKMFWGDLAANPLNWSNDSITLRTSMRKEPTVTAMGVESNMTSQHYDLIIMDDVVNKDYVNTKEQIDKTISFYKECLNLLEPDGEMVIVGTRWHDSDLYGWIMDPDNNLERDFKVFIRRAYEGSLESDEEFKGIFPEKYSRKHLKQLYEQQGPYVFGCTPEETPILMADFTEKPISKVNAGDEIIGFKRGLGTDKNYLVKTKVINTFKKRDFVYDLKMESGNRVKCTKDHKWYSGRKDKTHQEYKPVKKGGKLMFVCPTGYKKARGRRDWEYGYWQWLGGIFDGDGSSKGPLLSITQGIHNKPVCDRIRKVLTSLNIPYTEVYRDNSKHDKWHDSIAFNITETFNTSIRLIRNADFGKKSQLIERLMAKGGRFVKIKDRVISMKRGKERDVYALETETGNYIAWGYASSNTQYLNDPIPEADADFKKDWFGNYEPTELRGKLLTKFTTVDPAISQDRDADFTAIITVGIDEFRNIYILDIRRARMTPKEIIDNIFEVWHFFDPIAIGIEDVAFQKSLQYSLSEEMNRRNEYLPLKPLRPAGRAKDQRIKGLQPLYANRKIYHSRAVPNIEYLEDELLRFPAGKHDDIIDALAYMLELNIYPPKRKKTMNHHRYLYA